MFYSICNFPIPSRWIAADGSNYGYIATGIDSQRDDIQVDETINGLTTGVKRSIDYYKIQYRYKEIK